MTLTVIVNGAAIAAGGTYTAPTPGDQDVTFEITVAPGGVFPAGLGGPWRFIVSLEEEEEPLLDKIFSTRTIKFKKKFTSGTHNVVIGVLDEGLRGRRASYEEIKITIEITELLPRPTLLVAITKPEKENRNIILKKNAKGEFYHDPVTFECEIKGGKPPFNVRFWSYSASNNPIWGSYLSDLLIEPSTRNRTISFSRGGEERPVPPPGLAPDWRIPASLPAGEHEINITVKAVSYTHLTLPTTPYV